MVFRERVGNPFFRARDTPNALVFHRGFQAVCGPAGFIAPTSACRARIHHHQTSIRLLRSSALFVWKIVSMRPKHTPLHVTIGFTQNVCGNGRVPAGLRWYRVLCVGRRCHVRGSWTHPYKCNPHSTNQRIRCPNTFIKGTHSYDRLSIEPMREPSNGIWRTISYGGGHLVPIFSNNDHK